MNSAREVGVMKDKDININIVVDLQQSNIIRALVDELEYNEIIDFIKRLDLVLADWDFTEALYEYFQTQHELFLKEEKEYSDDDDSVEAAL